MKFVVKFTSKQEEKALPIIVRHSAGFVLRGRTYILSEETINLIRQEGIKFTAIARDSPLPDDN